MRVTISKEGIPWAMAAGRALLGPMLIAGEKCGWNGVALACLAVTALVTDIFDGVLARRWKCDTPGVRLFDTMSDTVFYLCVALALWIGQPQMLRAHAGLLAGLLALEMLRFGVDFAKFGKPASYHTYLAKTWGLSMAAAVIAVLATGHESELLSLVLVLGIVCDVEGLAMSLMLPFWQKDVKTLRAAWLRRKMVGTTRTPRRSVWPTDAGKGVAVSGLLCGLCVLMAAPAFAVSSGKASYTGGTEGVAGDTVGTFDRTSIVVAFYDSPMWSAKLNAAHAEQDKAKAAGDQKKVAELNKRGKDQQKLAHKQMAGNTNIDNILETMKPMFTAVEAEAHVRTIVPEGARIAKTAVKVDVTGLLMDQLHADANTRQSAEQLRNFKKAHPMEYRLTMFLFRFEGD